jgi:hypothetical protein
VLLGRHPRRRSEHDGAQRTVRGVEPHEQHPIVATTGPRQLRAHRGSGRWRRTDALHASQPRTFAQPERDSSGVDGFRDARQHTSEHFGRLFPCGERRGDLRQRGEQGTTSVVLKCTGRAGRRRRGVFDRSRRDQSTARVEGAANLDGRVRADKMTDKRLRDTHARSSPSQRPWRYIAPSARSCRPYPGRPRSPQIMRP